ncbi:hypothetical protein QAD02_021491 [Eretmocerus hayati]|uniref:Uncharacterized protein n=1 Tax=Eretmocerus hayati TaxID=131215 RepID=A0ACC2PRF7_9HYME|nr:hypothetical protein QAD02_021491 [Eretmocerus hayati]
MDKLSEEGLKCRINGESMYINVYALCSCVDSMAQGPMQGCRVCTASGGCNWYLHLGEAVHSLKNQKKKTIYYTLQETVPPRRTDADTVKHMEQALVTGEAVFGLKYVSPLVNLKYFKIVNGWVPDILHCGSLVPEQAARLSRSFKSRKFWHGREWDNWALAYSLPILMTFPRFRKYAEHWGMYCEAIHILMSDEISHEDLLKAHNLLNNFVALTQILYGKRAMTFNVNQLTHLAQSVADFGPLGEHNGYTFESGNGEILKTVHSGKGVINQICRNVNMGTSLQTIGNGIQRHDFPAVQFCRSLKKTETVKSLEVGGCRCFGKASVTPDWVLQGINVAGDQCGVRHRVCKQGCLYRSTKKVLERSDNSHV